MMGCLLFLCGRLAVARAASIVALTIATPVACATGTGDVRSTASASVALPDGASGPLTESQLEFQTRLRNVLRGTQRVKETLVIARDHRSGVALWYSTPRPGAIAAFLDSEGGGTGTAKVLATADRMVRFVALGAPLTIVVHDSTHTFSSVEEATSPASIHGERSAQPSTSSTTSGKVAIEVRREVTAVHFGGDDVGEQMLLVGRDAQTGLTLWAIVDAPNGSAEDQMLHTAASPGDTAVAVVPDEIVRVTVLNLRPDLAIVRSRTRFGSIDAALRELKAMLTTPPTAQREPSIDTFVVSLAAELGPEFSVHSGASSAPLPKVESVERSDGGWLINLVSHGGNTAVIVLDSDYRLLEVRKDR